MVPNPPPASLYAAFDVFPSRKGAAIHIDHFSRALFNRMGGGLLHVLGDGAMPAFQQEENITIVRPRLLFPNYLARALGYSEHLARIVAEAGAGLKLCQFRDVWSGVPLLSAGRHHAAVFEVNALASIELPSSYAEIAPSTLAKLRAQESFCLRHADHIVTPSHVLQKRIIALGIAPEKISVIPNGASLNPPCPRPTDAPGSYLLYFGALQPWQGVDVLLRAFARLADLPDLHLVICASHDSRRARALQRLAHSLQISARIRWHCALSEEDLAPWREHALLSVAPLTECARNLDQGCSPLKILESMSSGVPVVASDLPAVRELMVDRVHGRLVHPDRPGELARVIRVLLHHPETLREMGDRARTHIAENFLWDHALSALNRVYSGLLDRNREPTLMLSPHRFPHSA